jgi:hypothetical protein
MSSPKPEVVQTLEFSHRWHPLAVKRVMNFFDERGQLREVYYDSNGYKLTIAFTDDTQAQAFKLALELGHFPKGAKAMF